MSDTAPERQIISLAPEDNINVEERDQQVDQLRSGVQKRLNEGGFSQGGVPSTIPEIEKPLNFATKESVIQVLQNGPAGQEKLPSSYLEENKQAEQKGNEDISGDHQSSSYVVPPIEGVLRASGIASIAPELNQPTAAVRPATPFTQHLNERAAKRGMPAPLSSVNKVISMNQHSPEQTQVPAASTAVTDTNQPLSLKPQDLQEAA